MQKRYNQRHKGNTLPYDASLRSGQCLWGPLVRGPTVEFEPPTGNRIWHHRKREKNYTCTQLDQQGKTWATKAQQDWPINVAINSWLLDM
jgi:hypothetical protein